MKGRLLAFDGRRKQAPTCVNGGLGILDFQYDRDDGL